MQCPCADLEDVKMAEDSVISYTLTHDAVDAAETGEPTVWIEANRTDYACFDYNLSAAGTATLQIWTYNREFDAAMAGGTATLSPGNQSETFAVYGRTVGFTVTALSGTITARAAFLPKR